MVPVITVHAKNLPRAWEDMVLDVWYAGIDIKTPYDAEDALPSKDATGIMVIEEPLSEPRIHRCMPGGIEDLYMYRAEVCDGIHDHWIGSSETAWTYTYHERLTRYTIVEETMPGGYTVNNFCNQIEYIIRTLSNEPYSRRAQAIIWDVAQDTDYIAKQEHPPCLQRLWYRIIDNKLICNAHMRSNDLFKATMMNCFAFIELQKIIADRLTENLGYKIEVGQYTHMVDSLHIYSSYFNDIEKFLQTLEKRSFKERTFNTTDPMIKEIIDEVQQKIVTKYPLYYRG